MFMNNLTAEKHFVFFRLDCRLQSFTLWLLWILTSGSLWAQQADTVYLKEGFVLIGKCTKLTAVDLTFEAVEWGSFQIKIDKVERFKLHHGSMLIESIHYKNYFTNQVRLENDTLHISTPDGEIQLTLNEINFLMPVRSLIHSGFIAMGHQFAYANRLGLFNLDFRYSYKNTKYEYSLAGNGVYALSEQLFIRTKENLNTYVYRTLGSGFSAAALLSYDRNFAQNLLARYQIAAGFRYRIFSANTLNLSVASGGMFKNEQAVGDFVSNRFVLPVQIVFGMSDKKNSKWTINLIQSVFYSNFLFNRIRSENELRANLRLIRRISLTTFMYSAYDTMPLSPTAGKIDYGWTGGLRFDF
jgi:hypothetical protein